VVSDLHLTLSRDPEDQATDREFAAFLDHYRKNRADGRPWRLVMAGDVFDLLYPDMELFVLKEGHPPDAPKATTLGFLEHWDIPAQAWRARSTMRQRTHLFRSLGQFVLAGNDVVIIKGNHDVELQWAVLQRTVLDTLAEVLAEAGIPVDRALLAERIRFHQWFYFEEGQLWVEHGNQYDEFNSYPNFLDPALVTDPQRAFAPMGSRMTHYLTTACLDYKPGPAHGTFMSYLRRTGQLTSGKFLGRSWAVMRDALTQSGAFSEEGWRTGAGRENLDIDRLAERSGVPIEVLRQVAALQAPPATAVRGFFFNRMLLDRLFVVGFTLLLLVNGLAWGLFPPTEPSLLVALAGAPLAIGIALFLRFKLHWRTLRYKLVLVGLLTAAASLAPLVFAGCTWQGTSMVGAACAAVGAAVSIMPVPDMMDLGVHLVRIAGTVARITGARVVVFGHHHRPRVVELREGGVYVNAGAWVNTGVEANHAHVVALRDAEGNLSASLRRGRDFL
jgi:UDP-2,3-diacylglucosamine pyrophosphatase LpxH